MKKNNTDVIIDNKVYTITSEEDSVYIQKLADYVNTKLEQVHHDIEFIKQPSGIKQMLLLLNVVNDYFKMKEEAEDAVKKYKEQQNEFYNMKCEMVNMKLELEKLRQLQKCLDDHGAVVTSPQCPYLKALEENKVQKTDSAESEKHDIIVKGAKPPYEKFNIPHVGKR